MDCLPAAGLGDKEVELQACGKLLSRQSSGAAA